MIIHIICKNGNILIRSNMNNVNTEHFNTLTCILDVSYDVGNDLGHSHFLIHNFYHDLTTCYRISKQPIEYSYDSLLNLQISLYFAPLFSVAH